MRLCITLPLIVAALSFTLPGELAYGFADVQRSSPNTRSHADSTAMQVGTAPAKNSTFANGGTAHTSRSGGTLAADWRYVYHHGRHWYWMPNKTWSVWNRGTWMPYSPGAFTPRNADSGRQVTGYRGVPLQEQSTERPANYSAALDAAVQFSRPVDA